MKTLFVFILGLAIGAVALYYYQRQPVAGSTREQLATTTHDATEAARASADRAVDKTRAAASDVSDAVQQKMRDWNLTPENIRAELGRGKEVVRENAARAGEKIADARIVTMIKAKYVLDRDLSAVDIDVDSRDGRVTLNGSVASEAALGKAVALALDTDGVRNVSSRLSVAAQ